MQRRAQPRCPTAHGADARDRSLRHALLPPLIIALMVVTAGTLGLLAAAVSAPPVLPAMAPTSPAATGGPAAADRVEASTLVQTAHAVLPATPAVVDLARLTYAAKTTGTSQTYPGPLLLVVASGALTTHVAAPLPVVHPDQPATAPAQDLVLRPGDGVLLPAATAVAFGNAAAVPAVVLVAGIFPASPILSDQGRVGPARWAEAWSPGASVEPLAGGWLMDGAPGPATIVLQRLSVPEAASLPLTAAGLVDLAVETGALTLETTDGLVWHQPPQGPDTLLAAPTRLAMLLPGDAALLQEPASVTLRNAGAGPLLLLMVTVTPSGTAEPSP